MDRDSSVWGSRPCIMSTTRIAMSHIEEPRTRKLLEGEGEKGGERERWRERRGEREGEKGGDGRGERWWGMGRKRGRRE